MKAELTHENHRDFSQRHQGTFGFLNVNNVRRLVYVNAVGRDRVNFIDNTNTPYHANVNSGIEFEFIPVSRGWINCGDGVARFFNRVPARQWQRGISVQNTACYKLHVNASKNITALHGDAIAFNTLDSAYTNPVPVLEAIKAFKANERPSVALTHHFLLDNYSLWFCDKKVGSVKNNVLTLAQPDIAQEIRDTFELFDIPLEINVNG